MGRTRRNRLSALKTTKCVDTAYRAGVRIAAAKPDEIEFATTGGPAVMISSKAGNLYVPADPSVFEKIQDEETQMCLAMALMSAYPPRLAVVRTPAEAWEAAY